MQHRVLFGVASQTLRYVTPEYVATVTYAIEDLTHGQGVAARTISSGTATSPTFTLTLDGAAGAAVANPQSIPVAATAGPSIGDACVVIAADGSLEGFAVEAIATDNYLLASSLLAGAYATSDTVRGVTHTAAVPAGLYDDTDADAEARLDDQRPLRIVWQYTAASGAIIRDSQEIILSRGNAAAASVAPALEVVREGYPDLAGRLIEGMTAEGLGRYSLRQLIADLAAYDVDHARIMLGDRGVLLLAAKIVAEASRRGYTPGQRDLGTFAEEAAADYARQLAAIVTGVAGLQAMRLDTDDVSNERIDTTYRGPVLSQ